MSARAPSLAVLGILFEDESKPHFPSKSLWLFYGRRATIWGSTNHESTTSVWAAVLGAAGNTVRPGGRPASWMASSSFESCICGRGHLVSSLGCGSQHGHFSIAGFRATANAAGAETGRVGANSLHRPGLETDHLSRRFSADFGSSVGDDPR